MSEVIDLEQYQRVRSAPPLVFIDMFQDQLEREEGFGPRETVPMLGKCRYLLEEARARHWPIAFVRPPVSPIAGVRPPRWIEGFEPRRADMVFDRAGPSCYSSEEFADAMDDAGRVYVLVGFSIGGPGLATLIDAAQSNHFVGIVRDATATRPLPGHDAAGSHAAVVTVASRFATVVTAEHWIGVASGRAQKRTNVSSLK